MGSQSLKSGGVRSMHHTPRQQKPGFVLDVSVSISSVPRARTVRRAETQVVIQAIRNQRPSDSNGLRLKFRSDSTYVAEPLKQGWECIPSNLLHGKNRRPWQGMRDLCKGKHTSLKMQTVCAHASYEALVHGLVGPL